MLIAGKRPTDFSGAFRSKTASGCLASTMDSRAEVDQLCRGPSSAYMLYIVNIVVSEEARSWLESVVVVVDEEEGE